MGDLNIDSGFRLSHRSGVGDSEQERVTGGVLRHFTTSDGGVIAYRDTGLAGTRPLVLLHGLMAHGGFFREQEELAERFRLVIPDLRGHGGSLQPAGTCTIDRLAADVTELIETLELEGAIGLGWSLGATILWHVLAGRAADRFSGAVVVDMTARVRNDQNWALGLPPEVCEARTSAMQDDFPAFAASAGHNIFAQPVQPRQRAAAKWASAEFARNDPDAMTALWASLEEQDVRSLLERIRQPTLIIHGAQSSLYGERTADHLVAALADARAVRFHRSGHAPHLEEPDRFNRTISEFAASLPPVHAQAQALPDRRM